MNWRSATRGLWVAGALVRSLAKSPASDDREHDGPEVEPADADGDATESSLETELAGLPSPRPPRWKIAVSVLIVALALTAVGLAQTHSGRRVTSKLGLSRSSEPYTELYFTDAGTVGSEPLQSDRGVAFSSVSFVIANHLHSTTSYRWRIRSTPQSPIATGTMLVAAGQARIVNTVVRVHCRGRLDRSGARTLPTQFLTQVSLVGHKESIRYRQDCYGS
jgi:hypothetical protein